jgi:hypothetical protein
MALEQAFSSGRRMEPNLALESSPHQDNHEVNINLNPPTSYIINIVFPLIQSHLQTTLTLKQCPPTKHRVAINYKSAVSIL